MGPEGWVGVGIPSIELENTEICISLFIVFLKSIARIPGVQIGTQNSISCLLKILVESFSTQLRVKLKVKRPLRDTWCSKPIASDELKIRSPFHALFNALIPYSKLSSIAGTNFGGVP